MYSVSRHDPEPVRRPHASAPARPAAVDRLLQCPGARGVEVRNRRFLFHQGDACRGIYYLRSGMVSLQRVDDQGAFIIFGLIKPGGLFSWSDVLGRGQHRNSAQAVGNVQASFIPRDAFLDVLRRDPAAFADTLERASREMQDYEDTIFRLCTADVPERLYWTLRRLAGAERAEGQAIEFRSPVLKRELAAMIGTSPEGVSRGIRRLEELNIARFSGRTIWLNLQAA
jgi:CRP/FNR family transcriptional regulator